jgi:hypothetical protein
VPPSPPPVNPAPPSGSAARKEAKQRQAATAKSEEGAQQASDAAGDLASSSNPDHGANMTRLDERHPFTRAQPSALERDLLYGGGLGVAALLMAIAFATVRPTGRRRLRSTAAPAWARPPRCRR